MLRLTEELGQPVQRADGTELGFLIDLTVRLGARHPTAQRIVVGKGRHRSHLLSWDAVATFEHTLVQLGPVPDFEPFEVDGSMPLQPDELLVRRDVLDTQIVDVVGHRMARVGEVLLTRLPDDRLEVAAVDVGFGAVVRRLGLHRIARRFPQRAVAWTDLHLTSERGHLVSLNTTVAAVHRLEPYELAHLLARLSVEDAADVLEVVEPDVAADAVEASHPSVGSRVMLAMEPDEAAEVLDELEPEYATTYRDLLEGAPPINRRRFSRTRGWRMHRPTRGHLRRHGGAG